MEPDNRWLPPSPHKEAVLAQLRAGRCHIEERGHNRPPLLVCQDGGVLELPRVRMQPNGRDFYQEPCDQPVGRQTRYSDICGSLNELKERLAKADAADSELLLALLDDVRYMLGRLAKRRDAYREFAAAVRAALAREAEISPADHAAAEREWALLKDQVERGLPGVRNADADAPGLEELHAAAERLREVANAAERVVKAYKEIAVEIGRQYRAIKGGREWDDAPRPAPSEE